MLPRVHGLLRGRAPMCLSGAWPWCARWSTASPMTGLWPDEDGEAPLPRRFDAGPRSRDHVLPRSRGSVRYAGAVRRRGSCKARELFESEQKHNMVRYKRGRNIDIAFNKARELLGKQRRSLNRLIDLFRPLDTKQCEIVATRYACWNDRLLDEGESPRTDWPVLSFALSSVGGMPEVRPILGYSPESARP